MAQAKSKDILLMKVNMHFCQIRIPWFLVTFNFDSRTKWSPFLESVGKLISNSYDKIFPGVG